MKDIYIAEVTNQRIIAFNKAKERGEHMPFLSPSMMSAGTKSIRWCPKQQRKVFLLSDGERRFYLSKIFQPNVTSIKEQYPLDYTKTKEIADKLKVIHPRDHVTGKLQVMTTDLVVEYSDSDGSIYREACWFKPTLQDKNWTRTKQKCDIEREYWKSFGVSYRQVIGKRSVSRTQADNIEMLSEYYDTHADSGELLKFTSAFLSSITEHPSYSLRDTLFDTAVRFGVDTRRAYQIFANVTLRQLLPIDMYLPLEFTEPVCLKA